VTQTKERDIQQEKRDRRIAMTLLELPMQLQFEEVDLNEASSERSIATIIELLKPPPDEEWYCRQMIYSRLYLMPNVGPRVGDHDQMQTRKAVVDKYVDTLQRLEIANRRVITVGEQPVIAQDVAAYMVEITKHNAAWTTAKPWFPRPVALEQTSGLLQYWGHPLMVSRKSTWHRVAAALLRVKNDDVALTRQMRKVHEVLKIGGTVGTSLDLGRQWTQCRIMGTSAYHTFRSNRFVEHRQRPGWLDEHLNGQLVRSGKR
jgi:hypothetical protein